MFCNVWRNKKGTSLVLISCDEHEQKYLDEHNGLLVQLEIRPTPFAPDVAICAPELHVQQDEQGFLFCHWCGKPLHR